MGDPPLLVVRQRQIETHSSGPIAASGSYRGPQIATFSLWPPWSGTLLGNGLWPCVVDDRLGLTAPLKSPREDRFAKAEIAAFAAANLALAGIQHVDDGAETRRIAGC